MPGRRTLGAATVVAAALLLASCATPTSATPTGATASDSEPLLTTSHPVTVLDDGDGAELCLGAVAESLPPQCTGLTLVGWDWSTVSGQFEEVSGVRWGDFIVTGTYGASAGEFTPTEVVSGEDYEWPTMSLDDFATPCAEPAGGWQVRDEKTTTTETLDAAHAVAASLEGYAISWVDQSPNPAVSADAQVTMSPEDRLQAMNDPLLTILNVRVTGDAAAAYAALRGVWGGMLCVSEAEHTEAELNAIRDEIVSATADKLCVSVTADGIAGVIDVGVVYDDGALQARFDEEHGPGMVRVSSWLVPAD